MFYSYFSAYVQDKISVCSQSHKSCTTVIWFHVYQSAISFFFVHFYAHVLKGVLISGFKHVSLNARKNDTCFLHWVEGNLVTCMSHYIIHRSYEIVWSMYVYCTGYVRSKALQWNFVSGSQNYLALPTVGCLACSDKWRPDKWHSTVPELFSITCPEGHTWFLSDCWKPGILAQQHLNINPDHWCQAWGVKEIARSDFLFLRKSNG